MGFLLLLLLSNHQEKLEGYFRYGHACYRTNIEPILLYRGERNEHARLDNAFSRLVDNRKTIVWRHFPLYISMSFFDYVGSVVCYAAVGISILWLQFAKGATDAETAGMVSNGVWSAMAIINSFSILLDSSEALTDWGGYASRVSELLERLEKQVEGGSKEGEGSSGFAMTTPVAPREDGTVLVEVEGLSLRVPDGRWLMDGVSFQVSPLQSTSPIFITSCSGPHLTFAWPCLSCWILSRFNGVLTC